MCGMAFETTERSLKLYCTRSCRTKASHRGHRYWSKKSRDRREAVRSGERFQRVDVFERDGWRCQLCGCKCDRKAAWPDAGAASVDHIVPLSVGGKHEMRNVQTAHLGCNWSKNSRGVGDQLRLVG